MGDGDVPKLRIVAVVGMEGASYLATYVFPTPATGALKLSHTPYPAAPT